MIHCIKLNKKPVKDISQMQQVLVIKYWGLWVGLEMVWKIGLAQRAAKSTIPGGIPAADQQIKMVK